METHQGGTPSGARREALSVRETASALGLSQSAIRDAIRRGQLPSFRVGDRVLIPRPALDRLLTRSTEGGGHAHP